MTYPLDGFDFVWASPPCQGYTSMRYAPGAVGAPLLIDAVRDRMPLDVLWCIENVERADWVLRSSDLTLRFNVWTRGARMSHTKAPTF